MAWKARTRPLTCKTFPALQIWGQGAVLDAASISPISVYISSTPWWWYGAVCVYNITVTESRTPTIAMCAATVTDAQFITITKPVNSLGSTTYFLSIAEVTPLRQGKCPSPARASLADLR